MAMAIFAALILVILVFTQARKLFKSTASKPTAPSDYADRAIPTALIAVTIIFWRLQLYPLAVLTGAASLYFLRRLILSMMSQSVSNAEDTVIPVLCVAATFLLYREGFVFPAVLCAAAAFLSIAWFQVNRSEE